MKRIPVNDMNQPLGEAHPRCRIPDAVIVRIRDLYEYHDMTQIEIAKMTGVRRWTVRDIVEYRRRRTPYTKWREVNDDE